MISQIMTPIAITRKMQRRISSFFELSCLLCRFSLDVCNSTVVHAPLFAGLYRLHGVTVPMHKFLHDNYIASQHKNQDFCVLFCIIHYITILLRDITAWQASHLWYVFAPYANRPTSAERRLSPHPYIGGIFQGQFLSRCKQRIKTPS